MANPQVAYDIVAKDKSEAGIRSFEKRVGKAGKVASESLKPVEKFGSSSGGGRGFLKTIGEIEKATTHAFGVGSPLSKIGEHFSNIRKIGQAIGGGFARFSVAANDNAESLGKVEAAGSAATKVLGATATAGEEASAGLAAAETAGTGLAGALGATAVVAAGAVTVLGVAAVAGYKFATSWAEGAAAMGRTAEQIGITVRQLQLLQGAGERFGVKSEAMTGAVSNFAQTVHDARYGRNNEALALMSRTGVGFRYKADGSLDYDRMMLDFSDAVKRQKDPQTAKMLADRFGVTGALPALRKGSGAIRTEMADVAKNGVVNSQQEIDKAERLERNSVRLSQMAERQKNRAGAAAAGVAAPAVEYLANKIGGVMEPATREIPPAAEKMRLAAEVFSPAATKIDRAADKMLQATGGGSGGGAPTAGGRFSRAKVSSMARGAQGLYRANLARGMSPEEAAAWAATEMAESSGDPARAQPGGPGRGLYQWGARRASLDRRRTFRAVMGKDVARATAEEQRRFRDWELTHTEAGAEAKIEQAQGAGAKAAAITRYYERPKAGDRDAADRAALANEILRQAGPIPVHVTVELQNAPPGTKAKVIAGHGPTPAVSQAMQHYHGP